MSQLDLQIAAVRARYETLIETTNSLLEIAANAEKEWRKGVSERDTAFKDLVSLLEVAQNPEAETITDLCGAEDWYYDDDDKIVILCKCEEPKGHRSNWHREVRNGELWGEWKGPADERAPKEDHAGES